MKVFGIAALFVALVTAQYGTPSSTSTDTSSLSSTALVSSTDTSSSAPPGQTHLVVVGQSGLVYEPNTVVAAVGDVILFNITDKIHTVTQSSFNFPCAPHAGGFDSNFPSENFFLFNVTVKDTSPIWFFCKNPSRHCQKGMAGAVNPPTSGSNTFAAFQAKLSTATETSEPAGATSTSSGLTASQSKTGSGMSIHGGISLGISTAAMGVVVLALV